MSLCAEPLEERLQAMQRAVQTLAGALLPSDSRTFLTPFAQGVHLLRVFVSTIAAMGTFDAWPPHTVICVLMWMGRSWREHLVTNIFAYVWHRPKLWLVIEKFNDPIRPNI